jgi:hypothetical protein
MAAGASIEFLFDGIRAERPLVDEVDLLLGIIGTLRVNIDGRAFIIEQEVPLVELADQLYRWINRPNRDGEFFYRSMESDEQFLLAFLKSEPSGWLLRSPLQEFSDIDAHDEATLSGAIGHFLAELERSVRTAFGVGLDAYFGAHLREPRP